REANRAAWDAMLAEYPPLEDKPGLDSDPQDDGDWEAFIARTRGAAPDLNRDMHWVHENLENQRVKLESAPSLGAWGLLKWARRCPHRFFGQFLPKALAAGPAPGAPEDSEYVEDPGIEEIRKLLLH